eukprot:GEMP01106393.1.p1 GENE.GEMP01106393.1~~GEMP01106393.1.p1  ORF type:complete len:110 (+),score=21.85 GEMP01106393.1:154-483(+)
MTQMKSLNGTVYPYLPTSAQSSMTDAFATNFDAFKTNFEASAQNLASAVSFTEEVLGSVKARVIKGQNKRALDVCVKVQCGGVCASTRTIRGEKMPHWNEEFELPVKNR